MKQPHKPAPHNNNQKTKEKEEKVKQPSISFLELFRRDIAMFKMPKRQEKKQPEKTVKEPEQGHAVSHFVASKKKIPKPGWFFPLVGGLALLAIAGFFIWVSTISIPSIEAFNQRKTSNSTTIFDRTGKIILYDVVESAERTTVSSEKISEQMKLAMISAEDSEFYNHKGIRITSTLRGVFKTLLSKIGFPVQASGGSTLTQQVIKNTILTSDKSIARKIKEWVLALKLEQQYSKEQILTMYLNEVPFGGNVYGVEAAARHFYNITALELNLPQSAYLAALVNRPSYLSPYGKNFSVLEGRKNYVLKRMLNENKITDIEYAKAVAEKVVFTDKKDNKAKALHFVEYVRSTIEDDYGTDAMVEGGFRVITTLDWNIQKTAEEASLKHALENEKAYNASNTGVVVVQPKTGDILAMVGSRDYSDKTIDGKYNIALAKRQPGSAFKSIVYAAAFELGYSPDTKLFDVPTQFSSNCAIDNFTTTKDGTCYAPDDYDDGFKGLMSLREALAQSRNIPAVKLLYLATPANALRLAKTLGMQSLGAAGQYGLTLVLGGGEVRLLDITGAYAAFAADGQYTKPHGILSVESKSTGETIYQYTANPQQALSTQTARQLNSVLSDDIARKPLLGGLLSGMGVPVAAKTGTTNNNRDAWLMGYTPDIAVGVWFGNNDNKPMKKGSTIAVPLWRDVMSAGLATVENKSTFMPPMGPNLAMPPVVRGYWYGNNSVVIDTVSKKLATDMTPNETRKEYVDGGEPHTILHYVQKGNPGSGNGEDSYMSRSWEYGVQKWLANHPKLIPEKIDLSSLKEYDNVHTVENKPVIELKNDSLESFPGVDIKQSMTVVSKYPIKEVQIYINDELVNKTDSVDEIEFRTPTVVSDSYVLRVVAVDTVYNRGQVVIPLVIKDSNDKEKNEE